MPYQRGYSGQLGDQGFGSGIAQAEHIRRQQRHQLGTAYRGAASQAAQDARGAAMSLGQGASPFAAMRTGTNAAADASARILGQGAQAQAQLATQHAAQQQAEIQERAQQAQRTMGGLIGGAGQLVGMLAPAFGPAAPAASLGGGAASALGGAMQPQAQQQAPTLGAPQRPAPLQMGQTLGMVDQAMQGQPQLTEEEMRRQMLARGGLVR
jgi:hypothetical protein